jgi:Zn finger protein HypA/HybF involved in hydrogenase expression
MSVSLSPPRVVVALMATDAAVGERLRNTVCGAGGSEFYAEDLRIDLRLLVYSQASEENLKHQLEACDAVAVLVNHIDAVSLEHLREAYRLLPSESTRPASILIIREPGRMEFKMSCPACGQKLWVRDEDVGRNGRCPQCKKTFVLPAQTAYLKSMLMTPDTIPMITVTDGHVGKCQGPIAELAARARRLSLAMKSATARVQVDDGSTST